MEKEFKSGDQVVLKSGGVPMTVEYLQKSGDGTTYVARCAWFVGDESKKELFFQDALKPYEAPEPDGFFVG